MDAESKNAEQQWRKVKMAEGKNRRGAFAVIRAAGCLRSLRRAVKLAAFALCLLPSAFGPASAQETVDQIVTLVNEDIITRTDLLWSLALDPKAPSPAGGVSPDLLRQKLDVMIEQRLIEQEARRVPGVPITQEELAKRRTALIAQFPSEAAFRQRVEAVGLTPQKIDELIREMIRIERFVDFRFRSFVFVSEQEIKRYYDERLAPEVRKKGQVPPALDAVVEEGKTVRQRISEILKEEKVNQEIDNWLSSTHQRADIVQLAEP
jgi:hypothetical protein